MTRILIALALALALSPSALSAATLDLKVAQIDLNADGSSVRLTFPGSEPLIAQATFAIETEAGLIPATAVRQEGQSLQIDFQDGSVAEFNVTVDRGFALFKLERLESNQPVKRFRLFTLPAPASAADVPMLGAAQTAEQFVGLLPATINVQPIQQRDTVLRADREGCTHDFVLDSADPQHGTSAGRFTATSSEVPEGWSFRGVRLPKPLDLTGCRAIRLWVHGDGKGQALKVQLADDQGGYRDDYVTIDFTGWRHVTLDRPALDTLQYHQVTSIRFYYNGLPVKETVSCALDQVEALITDEGGAERAIVLEEFESSSALFDRFERQLHVQTRAAYGIEPAAFGVVACATADSMDTVRRLETAANLPSPYLEGQWNKQSAAAGRSYLFLTGFNEKQIDQAIALARRGGFGAVLLGQESWCQSTGHYEIKRDHFADGLAGLKRIVDRFHAEGLRVGLHFLGPSVDANDPYLTPKPDRRLVTGVSASLRANVKADDDFIPAATENFPREDGGYMGQGTVLRIGDELIHYTAISLDPPGFAGCARGYHGTTPAIHAAGADVAHLSRSYGYHMFDMDTTLLEEVATRFAKVVNTCGIDMVYFDGSESLQGEHWYYNAKLHKAFYDKFANKNVLLQASSVSPYSWHLMTRVASADGHGDLKGYLDQRSPWFDDPARGGMPLDIGWYYGYDTSAPADMYEYILGTTIGYGASFSFQVSLEAAKAHPFIGDILELIARYEALRLSGRVSDEMRERLRVLPANRGRLTAEQTTPRREYRLVKSDLGKVFQQVVYGEWQTIDAVQDSAAGSSPVLRVTIPFGGKLGVQLHAEGGAALRSGPAYSSPESLLIESFDDLAPYTPDAGDRNIRVANAPSGTARKGVTHQVELTDRAAPELSGTAALYTAKSMLHGNDGWSVISRTFDAPLNLASYRGICLWLRGDAQGGSFKLQLSDGTRAADYYIENNYQGWRYHQLTRPEKDAIDYSNVRGLLLYYNSLPGERSVTCGVDDIRATPEVDKLTITDPWVEIDGRRFAWKGKLGESQYLTFWPGEAAQRHAPGLESPETGPTAPTATIEPGEYQVEVGAATGIALPFRVRTTIQPPERHEIE